jgi:DNA-3-methyladenine glycosylase
LTRLTRLKGGRPIGGKPPQPPGPAPSYPITRHSPTMLLTPAFFDRDARVVARALLGKVLRHRVVDPEFGEYWLAARIIETEAYYRREAGSHSSLGYTDKRRALFMPAGTIYMYYAHGSGSLNFSARGAGNAVLMKSGRPWFDPISPRDPCLSIMQRFNPRGNQVRDEGKLCAGQTLLCRALGLKLTEWNQQTPDPARFYVADLGHRPPAIVQCRRLGIPEGRDEHLMYRFVDAGECMHCTSNPLTRRDWREGHDYVMTRRP